MATWSTDVPVELISSDEEDDAFLTLPASMPERGHIQHSGYSMVATIAWICWSFVEARVAFRACLLKRSLLRRQLRQDHMCRPGRSRGAAS
eukprot:4148101-Pyramimonas_sp.AAC.1